MSASLASQEQLSWGFTALCFGLLALDVFVLGFPLLGLSALLMLLYMLLRKKRRRRAELAFLFTLLIFPGVEINNSFAERRADSLIGAIQSYKSDTGRYPATLQELPATTLERLPHGSYRLFNTAYYLHCPSSNECRLLWNQAPPFGRVVYDFISGQRQSMD